MAFNGSYGMHTVALRFANLYGRFAGHKESVIARFFNIAMNECKLTIYGDGHQTRDFIHVDDLTTGILLAMTNDEAAGDIIQLATGVETEVIELAKHIQDLVPHDVELVYNPPRVGDIYRNYSDITKARQVLGFDPVIPLEAGLKDTFTWFMEHREG